jgi:primosomal protein N'
MPTREKGFVICVENRGAGDLEVRKVYRVVHDKDAAASGYVRVIDESGEDYLYPAAYFVFVALPQKAKRAWAATRRPTTRRRPTTKPLQRTGARVARSDR